MQGSKFAVRVLSESVPDTLSTGGAMSAPPARGGTWRALLGVLVACVCVASAQAQGLKANIGEVVIENLDIGRKHSLSKLAGVTLKLTNASDKPVHLALEVLKPDAKELKAGYEAIPDVSWIKLGKGGMDLAAGGEGDSDIVLVIPKDKQHLGKKYQVYVWTHTVGAEGIGLGIESRILFTIAEKAKGWSWFR